MQSTHLFSLKVPLQLSCSSQIGRALIQMLTCRCLENIQSIIWALFPYRRQELWIGKTSSKRDTPGPPGTLHQGSQQYNFDPAQDFPCGFRVRTSLEALQPAKLPSFGGHSPKKNNTDLSVVGSTCSSSVRGSQHISQLASS